MVSRLPDEDDSITIELGMMGAVCTGCGQAREPGPCPECGTYVPVSEMIAPGVNARRAALSGLPERLADIAAGLDHLPNGTIPLSNDQFATVVADVDLFDLIRALLNLGEELESLKLDDGGVIGGRLRRLIESRVSRAGSLLVAARELSVFDPYGPAAQLKDYASRTGRFGVRVAALYVELLTVETIPELRRVEGELQGRIDELLELNAPIPSLLDEMEDWVMRDVDARISLVLGRTGVYTDPDGNPDIGAVFGAFAEEESPYEALAERSRRYLGHLLNADARDAVFESLLIFPAIGIGALDRPLGPLRIAAGVRDLLVAAAEVDPIATQALVDRTMAEGALVFAANERIRRGFHILRLIEESGKAIEEDLVNAVLDAYGEQAEGAFRTYGWLIIQATRVRDGDPLGDQNRPPTLGELEQRLDAIGNVSLASFVEGSDIPLRNAVAHSQWRWDREGAEVVDLRSGQRWGVEALETAADSLVEAALGADAGYGCFLASGIVELRPPDWLVQGEDPRAYLPMAQACFGAQGVKVVAVRDDGATVVIEAPVAVDRAPLLASLFGLSSLASQVQRFSLIDTEGTVLLDVPAADFMAVRGADHTVRDLALVTPLVGDLTSRGADPEEVLHRVLALQLSLVLGSSLPDVSNDGLSVPQLLRLADRLQFVLTFIRSRLPQSADSLRPVLKRISRARALATAASGGNPGAAAELSEELFAVLDWLGEWDGRWPGEDLIPGID